MYDQLPSWLKLPSVENNRLSIRLKNGSQIKAVSAAGDAGRSEAISLLIIDEAAFIEGPNRIEDIWGSAQQTLATGGRGLLYYLHQMAQVIGSIECGLKPKMEQVDLLQLDYHGLCTPERNQIWRDKQDDELGDRMAAQECDCDFTTSGATVFPPEVLSYIEKSTLKEPLEKRGMGQNLWVWEYPDYSRQYMVVADVARGDSKDYSAFHIIDVETCTQVAEFKDQVPTKDFGRILFNIATEYNKALLVIENANIGWATIQEVIDMGYENLYYSPKDDKFARDAQSYIAKGYDVIDKSKMVAGFTMSMRTRPLTIAKLDAYVKEKGILIQSKRTLDELHFRVEKRQTRSPNGI